MTQEDFELLREARDKLITSIGEVRDELNKILGYCGDVGVEAVGNFKGGQLYLELRTTEDPNDIVLTMNTYRAIGQSIAFTRLYNDITIGNESDVRLKGTCKKCGNVDEWVAVPLHVKAGIEETLAMQLRPFEGGTFVVCKACGYGLAYTGHTIESIIKIHNETFNGE